MPQEALARTAGMPFEGQQESGFPAPAGTLALPIMCLNRISNSRLASHKTTPGPKAPLRLVAIIANIA
jgi:hypothetical protein